MPGRRTPSAVGVPVTRPGAGELAEKENRPSKRHSHLVDLAEPRPREKASSQTSRCW